MNNILKNWLGVMIIALFIIVLGLLKITKVLMITWLIVFIPLFIWIVILIATPFIIMWMVKTEIKKRL